MEVRGKLVSLSAHALQGMMSERPRIQPQGIVCVLEGPDHDDGSEARKWIGFRTIIIDYSEDQDEIHVRSVSATCRRLPTPV